MKDNNAQYVASYEKHWEEFKHKSPKDRILMANEALHAINDTEYFYTRLMKHDLTLLTAERLSPTTATCTFEYNAAEHWTQPNGNTHGGAQATIYDICTTLVLAVINQPGFFGALGVTRSLNVTYLKPVPMGETYLVECEVISAGSRLAAIQGKIRRKRDGLVVSTCSHDKVNTDPPVPSKL